MKVFRHFSSCLFFVSAWLALSSGIFAQTNRGSITGTITDPTGAALAGAMVTATETNTGTTYNTVTSSSGNYSIPQAAVGTYTLTASAPNFTTERRTGIVVQINTATVLNIALPVGKQQAEVTVVANAPTVQSTTSDIGGVVSPQQVQQLPLSLGGVGAFRSPEAFAFLMPGVFGPGTANNSNGIYIQRTSGGQNFGDDVILDGSSAARPDNQSTFDETAPSVDALQEFRVETETPPAQFGRTTGAVRSFTTHSGANAFHGSGFDILRNKDFDANTYFNNLGLDTCTTAACRDLYARPKDTKNDYGISLGGPVWIPHVYDGRNKTFFFFTWEQLQWPRSSVTTSSLPTAAERGGDFSAILTPNVIGTNPCTGASVLGGQIFDPVSTSVSAGGTPCRTAAYPNNVIPASQLNPVALKALSYMPEPNLPGLQNNFNFRASFPTTNTTYTIRIDQNVGTYDKIFAIYDARQNTLLTGGSPVLPSPIDPNTWNQNFVTHYGRFGWDHTFGPSLLNHLNLGFDRWNSANNTPAALEGINWPASLGIANANGAAFPQFNINAGFPSIGQARADDTISNLGEVTDLLTWVKGAHTLTFGGDWRWMQLNNLTQDNASGTYNFSAAETAPGPGVLSSEAGYSFASFLLGQVDSASLTTFAHYPRWTQQYYALFVQDDYKLNPHLTLNLGLRWSVEVPRTEADNYTSNFSPTAPNPGAPGRFGALVFASNCSGCNTAWAKTFYDNFSPRIGFAFSPGSSGKTAIRGGYSLFYGPLFYSDFGNNMNAGYTASPNPVSQNGFSPAFNLSGGFPAYPAPPTLDPAIRNNQSVDYITPGFGKPPMIQSWSFQVQQQLAPDL
ncbi:MAG: TonB-dependent receptor, partial [Acidobacteriaceae bacterium]|nr:TonB-dependent receptor [Acidobacteriaceae bacterium]